MASQSLLICDPTLARRSGGGIITDMITVKFKRLHESAKAPSKSTGHAAAFDIYAIEDDVLTIGEVQAVRTGIALEIPPGWYGQLKTRSGMASKGFAVMGGVLDSDYRGEVRVILANIGQCDLLHYHAGDRIAQLCISVVPSVEMVEVPELSDSSRGNAGFGSTGN